MRAGERRRDRDDHALAASTVTASDATVTPDEDLLDAAHRRAQDDALAELGRHPQRRSSARRRRSGVSCAPSAGVEVALERARVLLVPRGGDVEERVEEGELARLAAEDRLGGRGRDRHELRAAARVLAQPGVERLPVPLLGARTSSTGCRRGRSCDISSSWVTASAMSPAHDRVRRRRAERRVVRVLHAPPVGPEDVVAGVVGRERADADVVGQRLDAVLRGPDEHAAELGVVAAAERVGEDAAADAVAGLEHDHRAAGLARSRAPP